MKIPRLFKLGLVLSSVGAILSLNGGTTLAATFDDGGPPVDETVSSIGIFRVYVNPPFRPAMQTSAT